MYYFLPSSRTCSGSIGIPCLKTVSHSLAELTKVYSLGLFSQGSPCFGKEAALYGRVERWEEWREPGYAGWKVHIVFARPPEMQDSAQEWQEKYRMIHFCHILGWNSTGPKDSIFKQMLPFLKKNRTYSTIYWLHNFKYFDIQFKSLHFVLLPRTHKF